MAEETPAPAEASEEQRAPKLALSMSDFAKQKNIGEGSFAQVYHVKMKKTGADYALKVMTKAFIVREKKVESVTNERKLMDRLDHPGVVRLFFTFQDAQYLYLGSELCPKGELREHIQKHKGISLRAARFYAAETLAALDYLHSQGVIHRDLKPENMLLSANWHIKLCDFGSAKDLQAPPKEVPADEIGRRQSRRNSFVGTAEYISPEVLHGQEASASSDHWAFGCVVFQMLAGKMPFQGETEYLTFQKVLALDYVFPKTFPDEAKGIVEKLLEHEVERRLGFAERGGSEAIRADPFFGEGFDFQDLWEQPVPDMATGQDKEEEEDEDEDEAEEKQPKAAAAEAEEKGSTPDGEGTLGEMSSLRAGIENVGPWARCVPKGEAITRMGLVKKHRGFTGAKRRQLLLTDQGRLLYYAPDELKLDFKGEIPLKSVKSVTTKDKKYFVVSVPGRDYLFEASDEQGATDWAAAVNAAREA